MKNYVCGICGKEYDNFVPYMACVSKCGEELLQKQKEEDEIKRREEVNAYLNRIKEAEKYLKDVKEEFKKKYPVEYDLNFGSSCNSCGECNCGKHEEKHTDEKDVSSVQVSIIDDGKGEPKVDARVNGKKVENRALDKLFEDPNTRYIAKMLGIL